MSETDGVPALPAEPGAPEQSEPDDVRLLLTGEGVALLTNEHRALLVQVATSFVGGRAVQLSVARDVVPVERPREAFDFTGMTPNEIVQIYRDTEPPSASVEDDELITGLCVAAEHGLANLCASQPELAADTLEILATSSSYDEREGAAIMLKHLAVTHRDAAIILSETLIRDPDLNVRTAARSSLNDVWEADALSPTDALHLLRLFNSVETDEAGGGTEDSYHAYGASGVPSGLPRREA